jgi:hypothetical protein
MTDHTPLTVQRLDEIAARVNAAEDGWHVVIDEANPHRHEIHGDGPTHVAVFGGEWDDAFASYPVEANAAFAAHARADVPALLAEVARLKGQRKYLITQLAKRDAETGRGDKALREFLAAHPGEAVEELPAVEATEACGKCKTPFDPDDARFDGHARHRDTPWCRRCVDFCHDTEIADHRCVICA